jgi:hypothetical protein
MNPFSLSCRYCGFPCVVGVRRHKALDIFSVMHLPGVCHWVSNTSELQDLISFVATML